MFNAISGNFSAIDAEGITVDLPDISINALKRWCCVVDTIEACSDFTDPLDYTFDSNKIVVSGGVAKLKALNDPGKTFNQNFLDDIGFVYNPLLVEFVGGLVQQKNQRPANATFGANYNTNINGNWGDGVLTGAPTGGATTSGGKLDLAHSDNRYVDYDADLNADSQQTGCIRFKITPNYNGAHTTEQQFFTITKTSTSGSNRIFLRQRAGGAGGAYLNLHLYDQSGVLIKEALVGFWVAVQGQEYEFEINYDLTSGATRLFIDGIQQGDTITDTGSRNSSIGLLRIGSMSGNTSNFKIDDFMIFSAVQHTTSYTPGSTVDDFDYLESRIELPQFLYPGALNLKALTGLTTTELQYPREVWNDLYWSGAAWVASDGSYAQANSKADILTNIASFPLSNTLDVDVIFPDSNIQNNIDEMSVVYTGDIYPIDNPMISAVCDCILEGILTGFSIIAVLPSGSNVKFQMSADGSATWKYWNGSNWIITDGSYLQSNTVSEVNSNISSLVGTGEYSCRAILHSNTGKETPVLDRIIGTGSSEQCYEVLKNTKIKIFFVNTLNGNTSGTFRVNFISRNLLTLFESDFSNVNKIPNALIDKKIKTTDRFFEEKIKGQFRYLFSDYQDDMDPLNRIINLHEIQTVYCYWLIGSIYQDLSIEEGDQNDYKNRQYMNKYKELIKDSLALLSVDIDGSESLDNLEKSEPKNNGGMLSR
jgi:hypothetical protein